MAEVLAEARMKSRNPGIAYGAGRLVTASHRGGVTQDSARAASAWSASDAASLCGRGRRSPADRIIPARCAWARCIMRVPQGWRRMGKVSDPGCTSPRPCPSHPGEAVGCGDVSRASGTARARSGKLFRIRPRRRPPGV